MSNTIDEDEYTERLAQEKITLVIHHIVATLGLVMRDPSLLGMAADRIQLDINMFTSEGQTDDIPPEVLAAQKFLTHMHEDYLRRLN